jgi:hypothetical protein
MRAFWGAIDPYFVGKVRLSNNQVNTAAGGQANLL